MTEPGITNYRIRRRLGSRFCYTMYEAENLLDGKLYVLKILNPELSGREESVYNFLHGARLLSLVKSDHVCKVKNYGNEGGVYFIVSEVCESRSLELLLSEEFPFKLERAVEIVAALAEALRLVHIQGVVHGILNPTSIYLDDTGAIRIDDFMYNWTVAHLLKRDESDAAYLSYYMSTEVYFRSKRIDGRADVYSLSAILLQMLTDRFDSNGHENASFKHKELISGIHLALQRYPQNAAHLEQILKKGLHYNANQRHFNMKEFLQDLNQLEPEQPRKLDSQKKQNHEKKVRGSKKR